MGSVSNQSPMRGDQLIEKEKAGPLRRYSNLLLLYAFGNTP